MKYSVIFLLEDQNAHFPSYFRTVVRELSSRPESFEVIVIANGTGGFLKNILQELVETHPALKAFEMTNRTSQAACLKAALTECHGEFIYVCGSYQQVMPESYGKLLDIVSEGADILNPWRQNRFDHPIYRWQSSLFNMLVPWISGSKIHDCSCNVRIFRREVLEQTELYGNMYRFLPILAAQKGFKTEEVKCWHNPEHGEPRRARAGFYNLSIYLGRIIDIFTLYFNTRFNRKPLRFFSAIGMIFVLIGFSAHIYIFTQKFLYGTPVGNRPLLILALLLIVLGIQSASVGLLGEIIVFTQGRNKKEYVIEKII